ncbi:dehydrodolichyl diphosphate synthase family member [Holotrichia oblita]|uniref:Dehydrodolichyl diphosphate synthase family member n=1 Tax=Holotrichia oblita TaxID=644536 RepID=A0ACB9SNG9_HOLOL|nr:dehydrodolichyl diphosphate synthase family member [Holotrichia oblita]
MLFNAGLEVIQTFLIKVLKSGNIPHHVAVIMDGNRRYAKQSNIRHVDGHRRGYNTLRNMTQWCKELGISALTVYAFSIDNFKRTPEEIDELLHMMNVQCEEIISDIKNSRLKDTCFKVIGDVTLLPEDFRKTLAILVSITTECSFQLTIALAYTSKDELTTAAKDIIVGVKNNLIQPDDVNEGLVSACLYTNYIANPDIVIRTSGEVRFSNFLLWQSGTSITWFIEPLWPNFSLWNLMALVFFYQRCFKDVLNCPTMNTGNRVKRFVNGLNEKRMKQLRTQNIK